MHERAPVGVGLRAVAYLIDSVVLAFTIAAVWIASGGVNQDAANGFIDDPNTGALLLITAASLVYFGGLEWSWGSSIGKRVMGLRVTMTDGRPLTGRAVLIRTACRLIDGLFFYAVAAILVWAGPARQRLGDRWAHTVVVRSRPRA